MTLASRILGRVLSQDLTDPVVGAALFSASSELDEASVKKLEDAGNEEVTIRSVLTCDSERGVCATCYGLDLARGHRVSIGEAVGIIAAQSIGEPGTQLTMRTFQTSAGAATPGSTGRASIEARSEGRVVVRGALTASGPDGQAVVLNRQGVLVIVDGAGLEREHHRLVYGARLLQVEGASIKPGDVLAAWDPLARPTLTEVGGKIAFVDVVESVTVKEQVDEVTGRSRTVVIESRSAELRPAIAIIDPHTGKVLKLPRTNCDAIYLLPVHAYLQVQEGEIVAAGDVIAKVPRAPTRSQDITGGLPRVAELLEARKPKNQAVIGEIDGVVSFGRDAKGKGRVVITPFESDGSLDGARACEYLISKGKRLQVQDGDLVRAGDALTDGERSPHDILRVRGERELATFLVNEIQRVYRLQGVSINDKHIEVIVRQMLRFVRVKDVGNTDFLEDEQVEKLVFAEVNEQVIARGGAPASGEPLLVGITKASLSSESFLSASSFQDTTRVLIDASIRGKSDQLRGLKENVIMGRLIPAGTGLHAYRRLKMIVEGEPPPAPAHGDGSELRLEFEAPNGQE